MPTLDFVIPGDPGTVTGGYAYDRRIIEGLRALGWEVRVHLLDASFPEPDAAALQRAERSFLALAPDALVMVDGLAFGAMPELAHRHAQRLRLVALVHHPLYAETGLAAAASAALAHSEARALTAARHIVVTSEETRAGLAVLGVDPARVSVVEPGTDRAPRLMPASQGDTPAARARSVTRPTRLLCVATLTPRKGHSLLLQALSGLTAHAWQLVCIGSLTRDASTVQKLRDELRALDLESRVSLHGEIGADRLAQELAGADLFVLPTLHEGYGMAVAEALAYGLPVIATRTGAIPRLLAQGGGLIVPPADIDALRAALNDVLKDPARLAALRREAQQQSARLPHWPGACARMAEILRRLAKLER